MTLASMMLHSVLTRALDPLHLEIKPSRAQVAGRLLMAGAVGAVVGAGVMALLAPASGAQARARLRNGLARVAPERFSGTRVSPNGAHDAAPPLAPARVGG